MCWTPSTVDVVDAFQGRCTHARLAGRLPDVRDVVSLETVAGALQRYLEGMPDAVEVAEGVPDLLGAW